MGRAHEVRAASMAKTAARKSKVNAKYSKIIYMAAKEGLPDPDHNPALKSAIDRAKKEDVPSDVINRALEKAKGGDVDSYTATRYEGFGPNNSLFIVECLTDNPNRTYSEVRAIFGKNGAKLGETGSVTYMFNNYAVFEVNNMDEEEVMMLLLEADCNVIDIETVEDVVRITADATEYGKVRNTFYSVNADMEFVRDEVTWVPMANTTLKSEADLAIYNKLLDCLDDVDDVQTVYHNITNEREE
jgi:YebC/PmpR family DNA-binding regulatory protein